MIVLHQFEPAFGIPNPSPFCMKLECFLRMSGLPYRSAPLHDLATAPKGKGPFVEIDGEKIGDSALIIRMLETPHGIDLDRGLTPAERALGHAMSVMLEERTYFVMLFDRWVDERNWPLVRDAYLGALPPRSRTRSARTAGHGSPSRAWARTPPRRCGHSRSPTSTPWPAGSASSRS